jgi:hypothetical protein
VGEELRADNERAGHIDDGLLAYPERVAQARRLWPEGRAADFERVGRRRMRDRATGNVYRLIDGCPLLGAPALEDVDLWFVASGRIVCLIADTAPRR